MLRIVADLVSGTKIASARWPAAQIGRLIQNTARQLTYWISNPPTVGPSAIEIPTTAPQTPSARARSTRPVNTCEMMRQCNGIHHRAADGLHEARGDQHLDDGAMLHSSEPSAKTVSPIWNTRRRPKRSPVAPASISSEASTRV